MTRAMFVTVLYRLEGNPVGDAVPGVPRAVGDDRPYTRFTDVSEAGVISGSNNEFAPQRTATRAEVAQIFRNFLRLVAVD